MSHRYPRGGMSPNIMSFDLNIDKKVSVNFVNSIPKKQLPYNTTMNENIKKTTSFFKLLLLDKKN